MGDTLRELYEWDYEYNVRHLRSLYEKFSHLDKRDSEHKRLREVIPRMVWQNNGLNHALQVQRNLDFPLIRGEL